MDAHHGDSHGPGSVANCQFQILIMGAHIFFHQAVLNYQVATVEDLRIHGELLELFKHGLGVFGALLENYAFGLSIS